MDLTDDDFRALVELHRGLDRQGPGDTAFARSLLADLPPLPATPPAMPRIADLGCGSGAATLMLAAHFQGTVMAVDLAEVFLDALRVRAAAAGLGVRVTTLQADMSALDWPAGSLDLIWSEGAAYAVGFERALTAWRPWLAEGGLAVVSEMTWFAEQPDPAAVDYWQNAYPDMADEAENRLRAERAGYRVLQTRRLPSQAWWDNYYGPLQRRMAELQTQADPAMQAAIAETAAEIALFERFSNQYGYVFYVLATR